MLFYARPGKPRNMYAAGLEALREERATREELPGTPTTLSPHGVVLEGGDPGGVPAVAEGRAGVQDEGSQLVALALVDAPIDGRDARWLDLCAGPGGKAALLERLGLPTRLDAPLPEERVLRAMESDKKNRGGGVRFALPRGVGTMGAGPEWTTEAGEPAIRAALRAIS